MAAILVKIHESRPASASDAGASPPSGKFIPALEVVGRSGKISSEVLRVNLGDFLTNFGQALAGVPAALEGYMVEEIVLSLDIDAIGTVSLIVGDTEMTSKAPTKLVLKRAQPRS
jgi:hypothetical protein